MLSFDSCWLIPFTTTVALLIWRLFVQWEVGENLADIRANGAADTLHDAYHAHRTLMRLVAALPLCAVAATPFVGHWRALPVAMLATLVLMGTYFLNDFNTGLNVARGLAPTYVSHDPRAARLDKFILWLSGVFGGDAKLPAAYRFIMGAAWVLGLAFYCGLLAVAIRLAHHS